MGVYFLFKLQNLCNFVHNAGGICLIGTSETWLLAKEGNIKQKQLHLCLYHNTCILFIQQVC